VSTTGAAACSGSFKPTDAAWYSKNGDVALAVDLTEDGGESPSRRRSAQPCGFSVASIGTSPKRGFVSFPPDPKVIPQHRDQDRRQSHCDRVINRPLHDRRLDRAITHETCDPETVGNHPNGLGRRNLRRMPSACRVDLGEPSQAVDHDLAVMLAERWADGEGAGDLFKFAGRRAVCHSSMMTRG